MSHFLLWWFARALLLSLVLSGSRESVCGSSLVPTLWLLADCLVRILARVSLIVRPTLKDYLQYEFAMWVPLWFATAE